MSRGSSAALLLLAMACSVQPPQPPGELDLAATVDEIVAAIEDGSIGRVLEHVSYDFRSEDGLDYADVQSIVESFLLSEDDLAASLEELSISEAGAGLERVRATVSFARGQPPGLTAPLPPGAVSYAFDLLFVLQDGRWQATSGRYTRVSGG